LIYNESKYNTSWKTEKLSGLGVFSRGISKHRPRNDPRLFTGGGYPLVQTGEIKEANLFITSHTQEYGEFGLQQSRLWDAGTLCITIAANIAETAILSYPMCFPDSVVGFQANKAVSSELFMYYVFDYIRTAIQGAATGSAQDNINIDYLTSLEFKIPSKEYQDKIVGIVGSLDRMILKNEQINDNLQQMAHMTFMHCFWGKPTNGTIGEILIEHEKSPIQVGQAKNTVGSYPFFTSGDAVLRWKSSLIDGRNIFMNTGGNAGVKFYVGKAAYSTDTWCVSARDGLSDYLYLFLDSIKPELSQKFFQGTGLKHLQKPILKNRPMYIPSKDELEVFNHSVIPWLTLVSDNIRESERLAALRDWLLPMLMNGQATIED